MSRLGNETATMCGPVSRTAGKSQPTTAPCGGGGLLGEVQPLVQHLVGLDALGQLDGDLKVRRADGRTGRQTTWA